MTKRKQHKPEFKARVALEAMKGKQTVVALGPVSTTNSISSLGTRDCCPSLLHCLFRLFEYGPASLNEGFRLIYGASHASQNFRLLAHQVFRVVNAVDFIRALHSLRTKSSA